MMAMSTFVEVPTDASPDERREIGRSARKNAPRSSFADWEPAADRPDPVAILERQAKTRVPELVPLRHRRMLASAFTFYRGGAAIMAADLGGTPSSGFRVQLCGDAHLSNFGGFAAPDRRMVFDCNDFDETLPGPWEWDVKRLAASFEIGARDRGFAKRDRRRIVATAMRGYRSTMARLAELSNLDLWYARIDVEAVAAEYSGSIGAEGRQILAKNLAKARSKDRLRALSKLTARVDGELRIAAQPPLVVPLEDLMSKRQARDADDAIRAMLDTYRGTLAEENRQLFDGYQYVHCARKVVGVGSVGTRAWIVLLVGRDEADPLFLQVKEAEASVLEPYVGRRGPKHHGKRVVRGQRLMQATGDILLGSMTASGFDDRVRHFYVRQLWDQKASARVDLMKPQQMTPYAALCGSTLARAHARSGDRIAIAGYLGNGTKFDDALCRFAAAYADQNELDFAALEEAVRSGRLQAEKEDL